jgi:2-oxoglutarate dehydrogenase E1 component
MSNLKFTDHLFGANAIFIEELYERYLKNPADVLPEWREYFAALGEVVVNEAILQPSWKERDVKVLGAKDENSNINIENKAEVNSTRLYHLHNCLAASHLIDAYRTHGHMLIQYDPLKLKQHEFRNELDYRTYGFTEADLDVEIFLGGDLNRESATLRDIIGILQATYGSRVGAEYIHLENYEERMWIQHKLEASAADVTINFEEKNKALQDLLEAEMFENYLHVKFPGTKRFSVEGGEASIVALEVLIAQSVRFGVQEVVLGMAHRGRLNTLTKVMKKPYYAMFSEFRGELAYPDHLDIPGDVKYHLGASSDIIIEGQKVHLSLTPNPSHLEAVNSVVLGKVRAKQDYLGDIERQKVLGLLIHGDAALAGQGSVPEALNLSQLKGFHTGGTLHVVINNQIGFTTNPVDARSSRYCTDIAKVINAPVFHVNGDDVEAVVYVSKIAAEFRAKFKKDVFIDIVCYRKYGHNEGDEPLFTQPLMYKEIAKHQTPSSVYSKKLIEDGLLAEQDFNQRKENFKNLLDEQFAKSLSYKPEQADWLEGRWQGFQKADIRRGLENTGIEISKLKHLGERLCDVPNDFAINKKIARQLEARKEMMTSGQGIDWATGEALAYASLLADGFNIRITGQDVKRGTFSHRHAVLFDQDSEKEYIPLNNLEDNQEAKLQIYNSNLSEFAVLGFEYGYSFTDPNTLVVWEAQFGDFANGAQVIIDQYVTSGEAKWLRMNGLVMLLPHGYEGQGPEHSSARLERFLQLCARDNIQVANCTTPASFFHILRRQQHRSFRKPLVVMSPKSLLRHKAAISTLEDMGAGKTFQPILPDIYAPTVDAQKIKKVILCTGKVYYDLVEKRQEIGADNLIFIRLEQLYPFPSTELELLLAKYPQAKIVWCQEEHENMGAFYFVEARIKDVLKNLGRQQLLEYAGRTRSASPAVGYMKLHLAEHEKLMKEIFSN